jgi:1-deoxy-D-xylulose-5-phosphate reductoisomerase
MKRIVILGSTGSIGRSTLAVVARAPEEYDVVGLAAGRNSDLLIEQIRAYKPRIVSFARKRDAEEFGALRAASGVRVVWGEEGAEEVASFGDADLVISAITGISGLKPTLSALEAGRTVALANKESMVVAGPLFRSVMERSGAGIIPVDSEHSGVFQCLAGEPGGHVRRVILTASGGPFLRTPAAEMKNVSLDDALNHPRWSMGKKVTIDSATMMNKGLELIEARWLFGLEPEQLDVLIHPQSIVHSLVEMRDGSVLAQLSQTDMKIPIQYALTYPGRGESMLPPLDLAAVGRLEFQTVNDEQFPLMGLAKTALKEGGSLPVAMNAANEEAVGAFIKGRIRFLDIHATVRAVMEEHRKSETSTLEDLLTINRESRDLARNIIDKMRD